MEPTKPRLTIGMAVYDDFDGVYFTLQSIRLYHREVLDDVEFIVVDNHPDSPQGQATRNFVEGWIPNARYIPFADAMGTAAPREMVFHQARGDGVLCIDSHVQLVPGTLQRLIAYFEGHPDSRDLLQGPMLDDDCHGVHASHMEPQWRCQMFGIWAKDPQADDVDGPPFEIPMHGLGLFACRRTAWLGFHPQFRGFGGEEGYIHEKFRQAGARTLCLPFLRWLHRFGRPGGVPYRLTCDDKLHNYLVGWNELGLDPRPAIDHFRSFMSAEDVDRIIEENDPLMPCLSTTVPSGTTINRPVNRQCAPTVSCLMATFGRWTKVGEAISCFLAQDYPFTELIILNNHPQPLVFEHPQIRILNEPVYPNLGACRNRLLEMAEGEFVRTWDDDDLYLPWAISQGVAHIGSAAAFKPRRSWFWNGREGGLRLCENVFEASWTVRTDIARAYGYKEGGGDEHESLARGIEREGGMRLRDFGVFASYVYRWGHGMYHISATLGNTDSLAARTQDWMDANQDGGGGAPLQPVDLNACWTHLSQFCDHHGNEVEMRALGQPLPQPLESEILNSEELLQILDRFVHRQNLVVAVTLGVEPDRSAKVCRTVGQLAHDPRIRTVYCIGTEAVCTEKWRELLSADVFCKLDFPESVNGSYVSIQEPVDVMCIENGGDPAEALCYLTAFKRHLSHAAVIAVRASNRREHILVQTVLEPTHTVRAVADIFVFEPRPIPDYLRWDIFVGW